MLRKKNPAKRTGFSWISLSRLLGALQETILSTLTRSFPTCQSHSKGDVQGRILYFHVCEETIRHCAQLESLARPLTQFISLFHKHFKTSLFSCAAHWYYQSFLLSVCFFSFFLPSALGCGKLFKAAVIKLLIHSRYVTMATCRNLIYMEWLTSSS